MRDLRELKNSGELNRLVEFALNHSEGWASQAVGTPVALVRADFYSKTAYLGKLGLGSTFLTTTGCGRFLSRPVSVEDRQSLLGLFDVSDPYAQN